MITTEGFEHHDGSITWGAYKEMEAMKKARVTVKDDTSSTKPNDKEVEEGPPQKAHKKHVSKTVWIG